MRTFTAACAFVLGTLVATTVAQAAPITLIENTASGNLDVTSAGGVEFTNPFDLGLSNTELNNVADSIFVPSLLVFGVTFDTGTLSSGETTYALTQTGTPVKRFISPTSGASIVDFGLLFQTATVNSSGDTVVLRGTETLLSDLGADALDFSPFASGGIFTLTLTRAGANFNTIFSTGGSVSGVSGTMTQRAASTPPVPEPATLLLLATTTPLLVRRMRRQRREFGR
jgi:hypothetical protein